MKKAFIFIIARMMRSLIRMSREGDEEQRPDVGERIFGCE